MSDAPKRGTIEDIRFNWTPNDVWTTEAETELAEYAERLQRELADMRKIAPQSHLALFDAYHLAAQRAERAESDREQLRAALAECARVMALDEPRFNEYHDAITDAERLSRALSEPQAKEEKPNADDQPNFSYQRAIEYAKEMGLPTDFPDAAIDAMKEPKA